MEDIITRVHVYREVRDPNRNETRAEYCCGSHPSGVLLRGFGNCGSKASGEGSLQTKTKESED